MTDNEIIKALECCSCWESDKSCEDCPENTYDCGCANKLEKHSLDLINRQKAEIERLNEKIIAKDESNYYFMGQLRLAREKLLIVKSETIKEFAERLKTYAKELHIGDNISWLVLGVGRVDNLVKEMTEV